MKQVMFGLGALVLTLTAFSFSKPETPYIQDAPDAIHWMSWEQMMEKSKTQPRKVVVDVYTDWCGWCKRMDATTFSDARLATYINQTYYAVKFDAEQKNDIVFKDKTYKFVKNGMRGYHELAAEMTRGQLSFPTVVFLDENIDVIQSIPGFRDTKEFEAIATYFGRNEHLKTPWETYQKNYKPLPKN
jgi:thioredoxin-related protein